MHLPSLPARPAPEPNVTPLLDVLLVLLVAFLVIVAEGQRVLLAQLPQPGAGGGAATRLDVSAGARYRVNGEPVAPAELSARLRAALRARVPSVIVRGDPGASYQEVITAMDVARGAGATTIAIAPRGR